MESTVIHLFKKYSVTAYCVPGTTDAWVTAVNKIAKISVLKELILYCRLTETDINIINKLHWVLWGERGAAQGKVYRE